MMYALLALGLASLGDELPDKSALEDLGDTGFGQVIQYDTSGLLKFDKTLQGKSEDSDLLKGWVRRRGKPSDSLIDEALGYSAEGDNTASAILASYLIKLQDESQVALARRLINEMTESGSSFAFIMRGDQKVNGQWPGAEPCDAVGDYGAAFVMGNPIAATKLAMMRINGFCMEKDVEQGMQTLLEASHLGEPVAEGIIGAYLIARDEKVEHIEKGVELLKRAVEHGSGPAALNLAKYYIAEKDSKQDERVVDLLIMAIKAGVSEAAKILPRHLYLAPDMGKAAAQRGAKALIELENAEDPEILYGIGVMYSNGIGLERDPNRALLFYQRSYERGYLKAGHQMVQLYHAGDGIEKNCSVAREIAEELIARDDSYGTRYIESYSVEDCEDSRRE